MRIFHGTNRRSIAGRKGSRSKERSALAGGPFPNCKAFRLGPRDALLFVDAQNAFCYNPQARTSELMLHGPVSAPLSDV